MNFGESLRIAMTKNKVSAKDFAADMGVTPKTISEWRKADDVSTRVLCKCCEYFGIGLDEFMELSK